MGACKGLNKKMLAILQYTECLQDGRNVYRILAKNNAEIVKTVCKFGSIYPKIVIRVEDIKELNDLLEQLNDFSIYGVRLLKIKSERTISERLRRFFS